MSDQEYSIDSIQRHYFLHQKQIRDRLKDFKRFSDEKVVWTYKDKEMKFGQSSKKDHERLFEELCFCILAANTSAEMGMETVDHVRKSLPKKSKEELSKELEGVYRFKHLRPEYIEHTRTYLKEAGIDLKTILEGMNGEDLREFFANNSGIKGISYKEASHFLRNCGKRGYGILDKHVIHALHKLGLLSDEKTPSSKEEYLKIEETYKQFASDIGIDLDELDLVLWSMKTGKVLK